MTDFTLALGVRPSQIDVAAPLMAAARIRAADMEAQKTQFEMRQAAIGQEARGLLAYADKPEFAQKWGEAHDRLFSQGYLNEGAYRQLRDAPSPLVLQSLIAQTTSPELQFRQQEAARTQKNTDREFGFRQMESDRTQSNTVADRALRERQVVLAEEAAREKPSIVWQEGSSGEKVPYRVAPMGRGIEEVPINGKTSQPNNPFSTGKMNEAQSKDALYASRMMNSEAILTEPTVVDAAQSSAARLKAAGAERIPFGAGRQYIDPEFQKFDQAKRDFINATLRRESGAVISPDEFANADKQYFPLPGDTTDVVEQKRLNRMEAIKGIAAGAGPGYKPPYALSADGKSLVPNSPQKKAEAPKPAGSVRVPPAYANDPEGTEYRKGSKVWVKQGDNLVPK